MYLEASVGLRPSVCPPLTAEPFTQNPGFSGYTQHWVLYTRDELIMSLSQVGKPLHEFEEELSRSYLIWTFNLLKPNLESTFPEYG